MGDINLALGCEQI